MRPLLDLDLVSEDFLELLKFLNSLKSCSEGDAQRFLFECVVHKCDSTLNAIFPDGQHRGGHLDDENKEFG